jgi:hypothetical protein
MLVRVVLGAAGLIAALLVSREAPIFLVVAGLVGVAIIAAIVVGAALQQRR